MSVECEAISEIMLRTGFFLPGASVSCQLGKPYGFTRSRPETGRLAHKIHGVHYHLNIQKDWLDKVHGAGLTTVKSRTVGPIYLVLANDPRPNYQGCPCSDITAMCGSGNGSHYIVAKLVLLRYGGEVWEGRTELQAFENAVGYVSKGLGLEV